MFNDDDFKFEVDFDKPLFVEDPEPDVPKQELGLFKGVPNKDYHKGPGISSSSLKLAIKAMRLYKAHVSGQLPHTETEAMRLGTATHKLILEALDFPGEVVIWRKPDLRTKVGREERDEFFEANKDKIIITPDQYDKCRFMRDSIMALPEVDTIFSTGKPELSGFYRDPQTRMLCKYRPDWRTDWCLADVKTSKDVSKEAFRRTINNLGYHVSAAHYLAGDSALCSTDHRQFIFLCAEPDPPYLAAVYVLGQRSLELGDWLRRQALDGIKESRKNDVWPGVNRDQSMEIDCPEYAFYEILQEQI